MKLSSLVNVRSGRSSNKRKIVVSIVPPPPPSNNQKEEEEEELPWAWIKATKDCLRQHPTNVPEDPPVQLLSWLYLSPLFCVYRRNSDNNNNTHLQTLKGLGITHVLSTNCMPDFVLKALQDDLDRHGIQHGYVPGHDRIHYDMIGNHWQDCEAFLEQVRLRKGKVVVHCSAGMNRSGLIAAAAMLQQFTLLTLVQHLKAKRGYVLTNQSFQRQLCLLAAERGRLGPKPQGYTDEPPMDGM